jgi:2-aminoadipate transaminase
VPRYDFDQGLPDPDLYPVELLARHYAQVLAEDGRDACNYFSGHNGQDMTYGHAGLRAAIAEWLAAAEGCFLPGGAALSAGNLLLANGSTNGIAMAINAFLGPGDALIVEELSYPYAAQFARAAGAAVLTVPVGTDGMQVDQLPHAFAAARRQGLRPRVVYTVATFHSPTGTVLPAEQRRRLLEISREAGAVVLDDNCYYHLWYDQPPPASLLGLDDGATVIQSGSFSKYLAPGLRMGWLAGESGLIARIAAARQDFAVSQLTARVIERYVRYGELDGHLAKLREAYAAKRDTAERALTEHCGQWVDFRAPAGGLYFWLSVHPEVDFDQAMAGAQQRGVGFRPGVRFQHLDDGGQYLRLSVAQSPMADIEPGIALLGDALAAAAR